MLIWLQDNAGWLGVLIGLAGIVLPLAALAFTAWRYVGVRRDESRQRRYENYHDLIHRLVSPQENAQKLWLDSQIAVAFELRNYLEYREVSVRILEALRELWRNDPAIARIVSELDLTLDYLRSHKKR